MPLQTSLFENQPAGSHPSITLRGLTHLVGNTIAGNPALRNVWVIAELSDVRASGGHGYMELIEKDITGQTVARLRAMIWRNRLPELRRKFFAATGRDIGNGLKVMVKGDVNFHGLYGISFTINDIDPSYTLGDMERIRREILQTLAREGVLDMQHKLDVPVAPQRIAVGYGDFINQLENNAFGYVFYPFLFNAVMQGTSTSHSVLAALDRIEQTIDLWDCVVIIRGGGSTSDLNGFDELNLARAVATFPLPVYVGIGHERDYTVLDEIACVRCKTPTAVAASLIENLHFNFQRTEKFVEDILTYASDIVTGESQRLSNIESRLPNTIGLRIMEAFSELQKITSAIPALASKAIERQRSLLSSAEAKLPLLATTATERQHKRLEQIASRLLLAQNNSFARAMASLRNMESRMEIASSRSFSRNSATLGILASCIAPAAESRLSKAANRLDSLDSMVRLLDPDNILRRGYSITRVNGRAVRDAAEISPGDVMVTTLHKGTVTSRAETTNPNK